MDYKRLKRTAPDEQKEALVRHLRERAGHKVSLVDRLLLIIERKWPEWRVPVYGLSFATGLAVVVVLSLTLSQGAIDAPEIDDIEFEGATAVVIESNSHPTTLIWLSEVDEEALQDDEDAAGDDEDEENVEDEEDEVEDL